MSTDLEPHEFCLALPEMPPERFAELVADIAKNGLFRPVVTYQGKILDGRHRYRACLEARVEPAFAPFHGTDQEAFNLVVAENLQRRDLTPEQRLDVASRLISALRERAKASAKAGNARGAQTTNAATGRSLASLPKTDASAEAQHTHVELAKVAGVSPRTAQDALTIQGRGNAEDWQDVVSGKASVSGKAKEVRAREKPKAATGAEDSNVPGKIRRALEGRETAALERQRGADLQRIGEIDAWLTELADIQAEHGALVGDIEAFASEARRRAYEGETLTADDIRQFCALRDRHVRLLQRSDQHSAAFLCTVEPRGSA
jgi:ParB-like chromosome segregation protein Spo0J